MEMATIDKPAGNGVTTDWLDAKLRELPSVKPRKELLFKVQKAGLTTIRSLFDCAGTPDRAWSDATRILCNRWLMTNGFAAPSMDLEAGKDTLILLNAIAARAEGQPMYASPPAAETKRPKVETKPAAGETIAARLIDLDRIEPSKLNPRKSFDEAKLKELAQSLKAHGQLQPILVRSIGFAGVVAQNNRFELIAGERRWRAAKLAGLRSIRAEVRDLPDRDVLELMVIENEQRDDVPPLEKAEGYHELTKLGLSIDDLAQRVGKSTSTIRNILRLRNLPAAAAKALTDGELPAATAQLIARLPTEALRKQAAKEILAGGVEINAVGHGYRRIGKGVMSSRDARAWIEATYMIELKGAPFDRQALDLVDGATACTSCPKRTGNDRASYPDSRADICTDPACYRAKVDAHLEGLAQRERDAGRKVLTGKAAEQAVGYNSRFLKLATNCWHDKKQRSYKQILKPALASGRLELTVAIDPRTKERVELVAEGAAREIMSKDKLVQRGASGHSASAAKDRAKAELYKRNKLALMAEASAAAELRLAAVLGFDGAVNQVLRAIVAGLADHSWHETARLINRRRGLAPKKREHGGLDERRSLIELIAASEGRQLVGLLAEIVASRYAPTHWRSGSAGDEARDFFKALGIDPAKTLARVKREKPAKRAKAAAGDEDDEE